MSQLEKEIINWIGDPATFMQTPDLFVTSNIPKEMPEANLKIQSLECIEKNELSKDEIVIYMFWLCMKPGGIQVEGIIHTNHDFSRVGEKFDLGLNIPLNRNETSDTFCILIYEEDMPVLLDFHDPIGLVSFHQNQGIAVYPGDFRKVDNPRTYNFQYDSVEDIELDAEADGNYKLVINISSNEKVI